MPFYNTSSVDGGQPCFSLRTFLAWLSTRALRGGAKLVFQITACIIVIVLLAQSLPRRASETAFGRNYGHLWRWGSRPTVPDDGSTPGGLRIVVFGASDIANPVGEKGSDKTWVDIMCSEIGCNEIVSMVPATPSASLSSNSLYSSVLDKLADQQNQPAGLDYSFFPSLFPVPWNTSDFGGQLEEFLARPAPIHKPKETVWVFNFGQWDIWNLAAMPYKVSEPLVDAMVADIFTKIDRLYERSTDETSIAFSDYSQPSHSKMDLVAKPDPPIAPVGDGAQAVRLEEDGETFRIIVPMIMDPSLIPGWKTERPELPSAHSKAEQLKHVAKLTDRWNDGMQKSTTIWTKMMDPKQEGDENSKEPSPTKKRRAHSRRAVRATADPSSPTSPPTPVEMTKGASSAAEESAAEVNSSTPLPLRDAIIYDLQEYLTEMIAERQLQQMGIIDQNGVGGKPESEGFREVSVPCIQSSREGERDNLESTTAPVPHSRRSAIVNDARLNLNGTAETGRNACEEPNEHLFYTAMTLSSRAIDEIGKEMAGLILSNLTLRGYWESLKGPSLHNMPTGFSRERR